MKFKLPLLVATIISFIFIATPTSAVDSSSNITVRPFLQNITINPNDKTKQFELTITNNSYNAQTFHLSTINFGALNDTGGLVFQGAQVTKLASKYGLAKWIELEKTNISLGANAQTNVKATITNDKDLTPGAHYAAIIVTANSAANNKSQLSITPKVSSLVFATKKGGESYDMHLQSISHNGSIWHLPTSVTLNIKSTGNTFIVPRGVVNLKQDEIIIKHGIINEQSSLVLPETSRNFDVPLAGVTKLKPGLFLTHYRMQVDYRYDGYEQFATANFNYTVINKTTLIIIAVLIIMAVVVIKNPRIKPPKRTTKVKSKKSSPVVKLSRLNNTK